MTFTDRSQAGPGIAYKAPCRVASTATLTLSGTQTIDGVAVVDGDRVLAKDQTTGADKGIYIVRTGAWERAPDWDGTGDVVTGTQVLVTAGTTNARRVYYVSTTGEIVIGTTAPTLTLGHTLSA
jgi:phage-related tail fiber protein